VYLGSSSVPCDDATHQASARILRRDRNFRRTSTNPSTHNSDGTSFRGVVWFGVVGRGGGQTLRSRRRQAQSGGHRVLMTHGLQSARPKVRCRTHGFLPRKVR
jgi:hypothetical protein